MTAKKWLYRAKFNHHDSLRIEYDELLIWADGILEAKDVAKETIRKFALLKFESELDKHIDVMELDAEVAETVNEP